MKIVFMGTPDFGIPSLEKLIANGYEISAVVTAPDKERGRGKKVTPTPIKEYALIKGIQVLSPISLRNIDFIEGLNRINADLFITVAFRILPREVYTLSKFGSINLHGSLLPKYRGAAPIQWAIINGDTETGLTTFLLEDKVDTGNIILQEKILIDPEDNFGTLYNKMKIVGSDLLLSTVKMIESGNVIYQKQEDSLATPAPKITKEICKIDWSKSAEEIHNLVRGLSPHPAAFFEINGRVFKIYKTKVLEITEKNIVSDSSLVNPILLKDRIEQTKNELFIHTTKGKLQILELQPEGRKRITTEEFLRGYSLL